MSYSYVSMGTGNCIGVFRQVRNVNVTRLNVATWVTRDEIGGLCRGRGRVDRSSHIYPYSPRDVLDRSMDASCFPTHDYASRP